MLTDRRKAARPKNDYETNLRILSNVTHLMVEWYFTFRWCLGGCVGISRHLNANRNSSQVRKFRPSERLGEQVEIFRYLNFTEYLLIPVITL